MDKNINSQNVLDIMARHYVQAIYEIYELCDLASSESVTKENSQKENGFGFNLINVCKENGITIKEVAEGTGIPKTTLYNITKRKTNKPRGNTVEKVFGYLKGRVPELTIDDLVKEEQE